MGVKGFIHSTETLARWMVLELDTWYFCKAVLCSVYTAITPILDKNTNPKTAAEVMEDIIRYKPLYPLALPFRGEPIQPEFVSELIDLGHKTVFTWQSIPGRGAPSSCEEVVKKPT